MDDSKDQTYFLLGLTQEQLARTLFPLGEMTKPEVRALARSMDLAVRRRARATRSASFPTAITPRSWTRICKEKGVAAERTAGEIVNTEGRALGRHAGVHHFTVGQRKGLGIAASEPLYVIATDARRSASCRRQ